ncbi:MAG: contractile injection system protein, VgrG/Pvc8 family [Pseudomonadota bacterium]
MSERVTYSGPLIVVADDTPDLLNSQISEVTVCESQGGLAHAELRLQNTTEHDGHGIDFAFEYSDTDKLRLGTDLRILLPARDAEADTDTPREVFAGRVSALEINCTDGGFAELAVLAEDLLMPLRMHRRTRQWEGQPVRDLLAAISQDAGLGDPVTDYLADEVITRHQVDESDLAFLRRLLADWDADVQAVNGSLQVAPRADLERGTLPLNYGTTLESVRIVADLAQQRARYSLSAFNHLQGAPILAEMQTTSLGPGEGELAQAYLGNFGTTQMHRSGAPVTTQAEAQAMIDAIGARASRRFVQATGIARGNPEIRVGTHLEIEGVGPRFANTYYTTAARHHFSAGTGYTTEFEAECAYFKGDIAA